MRYFTIWGRILYLAAKGAKDTLLLLKKLFQQQKWPLYAMEAYRRSRGIAPVILKFGTRWI
jgi:hypothetical protein